MGFAESGWVLLGLGCLIYGTMGIIVFANRFTRGARITGVALVGGFLYILGSVGQVYGPSIGLRLVANNLLYTGAAVLVPALLVFVLYYARRYYPARHEAILLAVVPALTITLVWTNPLHELMWRHPPFRSAGGEILLIPELGFWFRAVHLPFSWGGLGIAAWALTVSLIKPSGTPGSTSRLSRVQSAVLLVSIALPLLVNMWSVLLAPGGRTGLSPTAMVMAVMSGVFLWVFARLELISLPHTAYRRVMSTLKDGIVVIDPQGRVVEHNPAGAELLQASGSLRGRGWQAAFAGEPAIAAVMVQPGQIHAEVTTRSGEHREVNVLPILTPSAEERGRAVVIRDITARKRSEQALRDSEAMVRSIVDHSPNGVLRLVPAPNLGSDPFDMICAFANPMVGHYLGVDHKDLIGLRVSATVPRLAERLGGIFAEALGNERTVTADFPVPLGAGNLWFRIIAVPAAGALTVTLIDVTEERLRRLEAEGAAAHDPLTGLLNRRGLELKTQRLPGATNRANVLHTMLYLDLDGFKAINDVYGHTVGDQLLKEFAGRLKECVRADDLLARLGGDEFAVILVNADPTAADPIVGRLMGALSAQYSIEGKWIGCRPSVGLARFPEHGRSFDLVLQAADRAMYAAKATGGGLRTAELAA